jgi:DNA invertase Pin-like site-specific DNA recombinase
MPSQTPRTPQSLKASNQWPVCRIVAYYRVSTERQGRSGLGLEGQRATVREHAQRNGGSILAEYTEVESGRRSNRPQLAAALAHAKRSQAVLVVAKLDRLSRNVAFLAALMESKVEFVCCDYPTANKLTIHILVAVAEHEAELISRRTKDALQAYKARGGKLGSSRPGHWKGREHLRTVGIAKGRVVAAQVVRQLADDAYRDIYPLMRDRRQAAGDEGSGHHVGRV